MTAQEQMRAMLDQLMGTGRDGENNRYRVQFDDTRVCRSFLLDCCPHDILASTRMDIGECPKIHDNALRADFENASKKKDYYYDIDAMEHLQNFIGECDQRTEQAKRRLKETQEELTGDAREKAEQIQNYGEELGFKLAKAEELGAAGEVEESMNNLAEVEELRRKKTEAEQEYRNSMPASSYQQQKLRVCEVCCAYLGIHDNDRRLADHFGGKLHLGFIRIREKLEELKTSVQARREQREKEREERRKKEYKRSRSRSRNRSRRSRSKDRKRRSRSKDRDRRRRRSRSKERSSRDKRRSRSRDRSSRSRRSRSRSRSKRSRRSRSRSKSCRNRSHSRSPSHGSGSKRSPSRDKNRGSPEKSRENSTADVRKDNVAEEYQVKDSEPPSLEAVDN